MKQDYSLKQGIGPTLRTALTGLALLTVSSCAPRGLITEPSHVRNVENYETPNNVKKHELWKTRNSDTSYNLERVVINGNDLYVAPNRLFYENELGILLVKHGDHRKEVDLINKRTTIVSDVYYIPEKVQIDETSKKLATEIPLSIEGKFGKKAQIKQYDTKNVVTGIVYETEGDTIYSLRTIKINGKEWYIPIVETNKVDDPDALPFYMIEVEGSKRIIKPTGEITLVNENGFYRPKKVTIEKYSERKPKESEQTKNDMYAAQNISHSGIQSLQSAQTPPQPQQPQAK